MTIRARLSALVTLRLSAVLTLLGLGFMVWSLVEPTPLPVMLAMTLGQILGMIAFAIYLYIVVREIRRDSHGRSRDPS